MTTETTTKTAFHLSFDVRDLDASVAFYSALLGVAPSKRKPGFARFTVDAPPLVLSLVEKEPPAAAGSQRVSHLGFRVDTPESLRDARRRVEAAGLHPREETASRCCYAVQDKFWLIDPDGNAWELYRWIEDLETIGEDSKGCCS